LPNRLVARKQVLCSDSADRQNDLRLQQLDLAFEILATGGSFFGFGVTIVRGPALQDIGDENAVTGLPNRSQHFVEQLAGSTNEWLAASIFFCAGRLANDQPVCIRVTDAEDRVRATLRQLAASAVANAVAQLTPVHAAG
jgi:hypothetical protein